MVESSTRVERTLRLDAPLAEAWEMLLDVPRWGMLFPHVDTIEPMGEGQYLWRMEPLGPPGRKVRVVYACRYDADEATRTLTPLASSGAAASGRRTSAPTSPAGTRARSASMTRPPSCPEAPVTRYLSVSDMGCSFRAALVYNRDMVSDVDRVLGAVKEALYHDQGTCR